MSGTFDKLTLRGYIVRGDLIGAMEYLKQFPEQDGLYQRCRSVFVEGNGLPLGYGEKIDGMLRLYQTYYREVFCLGVGKEAAEEHLRNSFAALLGADVSAGLDELEDGPIAEAFEAEGWHFLGGRTGGYRGPYVWKETEEKTYAVELPDGETEYTVNLLDGFISRSWMDYLSFGEIGTGGWSYGAGRINCVKKVYDLDGEDFRVSLLKHEAQHAADLARYGEMSQEDLEYRAKLVELIYTQEQGLLDAFLREADSDHPGNGHTMAAERIAAGFEKKLGRDQKTLAGLPVKEVQATALALFRESTEQMEEKYGKKV